MKVQLGTSVDVNDLIEQLSTQLPRDCLKAFVAKLDKRQQDWGFTISLYNYFKYQMMKYDKECVK